MKPMNITISGCMLLSVMVIQGKTTNVRKKPFGHRMCSLFCGLPDCSFQYSYQQLCCNATFSIVSGKARKYVVIYRRRENKKKEEDVTSLYKNAHTTETFNKDEATASKHDNHQMERSTTRLLIVPYDRKKGQIHELNLSSYKVTKYPRLWATSVSAVAYASKYRRVFIGSSYSHKIFYLDMKTGKSVSLQQNIIPFSMAVDETTEWIFIAQNRPNVVHKMTYDGSQISKCIQTKYPPKALALDTQKRFVYVSCKTEIIVTPYDGGTYQVLFKGSKTYGLALDQRSQILYYNRQKEIVQYSLADKSFTGIYKGLSSTPRDIVFHNTSLYISFPNSSHINVVSVIKLQPATISMPLGRTLLRLCIANITTEQLYETSP